GGVSGRPAYGEEEAGRAALPAGGGRGDPRLHGGGEAEDGVPIVGAVEDAMPLGPTVAVVGVGTQGGYFPPAWIELLRDCVEHGLDVENGLHVFLADDPELRLLAEKRDVKLRDLRRPPADLSTATGENLSVDATI